MHQQCCTGLHSCVGCLACAERSATCASDTMPQSGHQLGGCTLQLPVRACQQPARRGCCRSLKRHRNASPAASRPPIHPPATAPLLVAPIATAAPAARAAPAAAAPAAAPPGTRTRRQTHAAAAATHAPAAGWRAPPPAGKRARSPASSYIIMSRQRQPASCWCVAPPGAPAAWLPAGSIAPCCPAEKHTAGRGTQGGREAAGVQWCR